jgi:multidrug resistance protein MdtO
MGSQIFILPHLDSIAGFVLFLVAVTAFAAWFMTSSPRLSSFGIQVAVAFYLINLSKSSFRRHSRWRVIALSAFCSVCA